MLYKVESPGHITAIPEIAVAPVPEVVLGNVNDLMRFQSLAYSESLGGNAGPGRLAMNACIGPGGNIDGFGNYLPREGHVGRRHRLISFIMKVGGIGSPASSRYGIADIYQDSPWGEGTLANMQATRAVANQVFCKDGSPAYVSKALVARYIDNLLPPARP
jgi:hypothetical protein